MDGQDSVNAVTLVILQNADLTDLELLSLNNAINLGGDVRNTTAWLKLTGQVEVSNDTGRAALANAVAVLFNERFN